MRGMAQPTRVLIVDDHAVVRAGVCELLEQMPGLQTCEASNGREALDIVRDNAPELLLLDISLPDMSGLDVLKQLRVGSPASKPRVIMFSMTSELPYALWALRLGAYGFISKAAGGRELLTAVKRVIEGEKYLEPELADAIAFLPNGADLDPLMRLTSRELEILRLLGEGHTLSSIADRLGIARKTVANACASLKTKLGLESTADLIRYSVTNTKVASH